MSYEPIGPMMARTSPAKYFATAQGRNVHALYSFIQSCMAQVGWRRSGENMLSGVIETWEIPDQDDYEQRIRVRMEKVVATAGNTSFIRFYVSDNRFFGDETGVVLACSSDEYRIFVCPFQLIIRPKSFQLGGRNNLLISMVRIPVFIRQSTFINSVIAIEADQFFNVLYGTTFLDRAYVAMVNHAGGSFEWSQQGSSNSGMPMYVGMGNDNIFFVHGNHDFFAPAWMSWGIANANSPPRMQGFLWNTVNWYSDVPLEYETHSLRGENFVSIIPAHFNNTMMYLLS